MKSCSTRQQYIRRHHNVFKLCWGSLMPKMWITYIIWYWWPLGHPTRNVRADRVGGFA
jgi:hypothetical protein